jgi:hypothetical protein
MAPGEFLLIGGALERPALVQLIETTSISQEIRKALWLIPDLGRRG